MIISPLPHAGAVAPADAHRVAMDLADRARHALAARQFATVVIVGGDTAAAVGDGDRIVGGTVAPGMPYSHRVDGTGPMVVTKGGQASERRPR